MRLDRLVTSSESTVVVKLPTTDLVRSYEIQSMNLHIRLFHPNPQIFTDRLATLSLTCAITSRISAGTLPSWRRSSLSLYANSASTLIASRFANERHNLAISSKPSLLTHGRGMATGGILGPHRSVGKWCQARRYWSIGQPLDHDAWFRSQRLSGDDLL